MILPFPFLPLPLSPILLLPLLFIPLCAPSWLMLPFSPFRPSPSTLGCAYSSFGRGERDQEEGKKHVRTYMGGGVGEEKREPGEKGGPEGGRERMDAWGEGTLEEEGRKKGGTIPPEEEKQLPFHDHSASLSTVAAATTATIPPSSSNDRPTATDRRREAETHSGHHLSSVHAHSIDQEDLPTDRIPSWRRGRFLKGPESDHGDIRGEEDGGGDTQPASDCVPFPVSLGYIDVLLPSHCGEFALRTFASIFFSPPLADPIPFPSLLFLPKRAVVLCVPYCFLAPPLFCLPSPFLAIAAPKKRTWGLPALSLHRLFPLFPP